MSGTNVIDDIVNRARQLGPRERMQFVREACGADAALFAHVVAALEDATSDLGHRHPTRNDADPPRAVQTPTLEGQRIGPYRVTRKLGAGGMGDVYLAERDDHEFQQRVA